MRFPTRRPSVWASTPFSSHPGPTASARHLSRHCFYAAARPVSGRKIFFSGNCSTARSDRPSCWTTNGHLYLSTLEHPPQGLLDLLKRELPESRKEEERRIIRNLDGMLYSIRSRRVTSGSLSRTAFFFAARKSPLSPNQAGIRFSTRPEAEAAFYSSIFSFAGTIRDFQDDIDRISRSSAPVMVTGEDGTGKESIVSVLYLRGTLQNNPLVSVNCSLLNEKSWDFLLENHHSPLADEDITIYFSSIDALSPERRQQLLAALSEMDVCRRNRVIFSCVCQPGEYTSAAGSLFMDKLCCLSLFLPPLRQLSERIPSLVNLSLSHLNADLPRQLVGAEPEALELLQSFRWPHNYTQFRRVMGALAVTAAGQVITAQDVRDILRKERHVGAFSPGARERRRPPGSEPSPGGDHAGGGAAGPGGKRRQPDRGVQTAGDQQDHPVATAAKSERHIPASLPAYLPKRLFPKSKEGRAAYAAGLLS